VEAEYGRFLEQQRSGYSICIFNGGLVPFVLRSKGEQTFSFVGECYIHGIMEGEAMNGKEDFVQ
jgi:hypothetical protein